MKDDLPGEQSAPISFLLSKQQRLFGWPWIKVYIFSLLLTLFFIPIWFFITVCFPSFQKFGHILLVFLFIDVVAAVWLVIWGPFLALKGSVFNYPYINTLEIDSDNVNFGMNGLQVKLKRHTFSVVKGNHETSILRSTTGNAFLVPHSFETYENLKKLIERENS